MAVSSMLAISASQENEKIEKERRRVLADPANYKLVEHQFLSETLSTLREHIEKDRARALARVIDQEVAINTSKNKWLPSFLHFSTDRSVIIKKLEKESNASNDLTDILRRMREKLIPGTYEEAIARHTTAYELCSSYSKLPVDKESFSSAMVRVFIPDWESLCNLLAEFKNKENNVLGIAQATTYYQNKIDI